MNREFLDEINLAKRDALVAVRMKTLDFKYIEQLYDYFLMDPLPGKEIVLSEVTEAVASMQHFLNRIANRQEPGLQMKRADTRDWNNANSRYSLWAGYRRLQAYPENFLDPTTRRGKTAAFMQLESRLSQGRIDTDTVQSAVLGYLNEFEKVCNLDVLSVFWEDNELKAQKMYFIGRPKRPPHTTYYWREVSLAADRTTDGGTRLLVTAWSEWRKIDSVSSGLFDDMIKPVFLNGRLCVVWCERQEKAPAGSSSPTLIPPAVEVAAEPFTYTVRLTYRKFDNSWSEPLQLLTADSPVLGAGVSIGFRAVASREVNVAATYLSISLDFLAGPAASGTSVSTVRRVAAFDAALNCISLTDAPVKSGSDGSGKDSGTGGDPGTPPQKQEKTPAVGGEVVKPPGGGAVGRTVVVPRHEQFVDSFKVVSQKFTTVPDHGSSFHIRFTNTTAFSSSKISVEPSVKDGKILLTITAYPLFQGNLAHNEYANYLVSIYQTDSSGEKQCWTSGSSSDFEVVPGGNGAGGFKRDFSGPDGSSGGGYITIVVGFRLTTIFLLVPDGNLSGYAVSKYIEVLDPAPTLTAASSTLSTETKPPADPSLDSLASDAQDRPQFMDFGEAGSGHLTRVQLNTLIVKDLVNYAYVGLDAVFAQQAIITPEPARSAPSRNAQDPFHGANGLYLWELFFHTPFLVAHRLVQEGRFADARRWLNYIFDPTAANSSDRWLFEPFKDASQYDSAALPPDPHGGLADPDAIAIASPIRYKKAILFLYINSFIGQGDACYRELERDSINEALQWYMQALSMLGRRPRGGRQSQWQAVGVQDLSEQDAAAVTAEQPFGLFQLPINQTLIQFWDRIDARLYNLRHNLTIDGKPMSLPAFDPPADPARLARAGSAGADGSLARTVQLTETYPHYRFQFVLAKAYAASESLIQFGSALQAALERKDTAHLERLQQSQLIDLQQFTLQIQRDTIGAARASLDSLTSAQAAAARRKKYYTELAADRNSELETSALALRATGSAMTTGSHAVRAVGAALDLMPNIFGVADGGTHYGAPAYAMADGALAVAEATMQAGYLIETAEQYRRRQEEWQQLAVQADDETAQLATQIKGQQSLVSQYQNQMNQIEIQHSQQRDMSEFMSSRFSNEELYFWMSSQLADLYAQAYDATVGVCQMAQSAWRWETGKFDPAISYIRPGGWTDRNAGLLKGEQLRLCLQRLEKDFLDSSGRKLEIIHTVSLKQHGEFQKLSDAVARVAGQPASTGAVQDDTVNVAFSLAAADFDRRYPDHVLRQIVAVTVTLPGVVGPYQDVRAILTQTTNEIQYGGKPSSRTKTNLRANQQVALSTGLDDSGLFALNFGDERYLPFEGTGAHSSWVLTFPGAREQLPFLQSLTDVIVRIRYTALPGPSGSTA